MACAVVCWDTDTRAGDVLLWLLLHHGSRAGPSQQRPNGLQGWRQVLPALSREALLAFAQVLRALCGLLSLPHYGPMIPN